MSLDLNFSEIAAQIVASIQNDSSNLIKLLSDLYENMEIVHTAEYKKFLKELLAPLGRIMTEIPCQFVDGDLQKIRNLTLEIFHRIPLNDIFSPHAHDMIRICLEIFEQDNEENSLLAMKIITDIHKIYKTEIENIAVERLVQFMISFYKDFSKISTDLIRDTMSETKSPLEKKQVKKKELIESKKSLKVITETPHLLVLFFQLYSHSSKYLNELLPEMKNVLNFKIDPPSVSDSAKRLHYIDFFLCQVKIVSFYAYAMKAYPEYMKELRGIIPNLLSQYLIKCPNEALTTRKELLVIMKHMIDTNANADLRPKFLNFLDSLLDEKILLGTNRSSYESMRPLAYNTLADLIHNSREKLSTPQISKIVQFSTKIMYDTEVSMTHQTLFAKLLVHLVETLFKLKGDTSKNDPNEKETGRVILLNIMASFVLKIKSLSTAVKRMVEEQEKVDKEQKTEPETISELQQTYKLHKTFLKTLILGLKNVIFVLISDQNITKSPIEEIKLFKTLFKYGLQCVIIFSLSAKYNGTDDKEELESFASLFVIPSQRTFQEVFKQNMDYFYKYIQQNPSYLHIASHFLKNMQVSAGFSEILLNFLVENMDKLEGTDNESTILVKIFRLVFQSISDIPANESMLKPYLSQIVHKCLAKANQNKESKNYFITLKILFKSISNGKYDVLIKEFLTLLPEIIEKLTDLLKGSLKSQIRDLAIELCLNIPVKIHVLAPHIPSLVKPVLLALEGSGEIVSAGLKNLDSWVDSLRSESLEPILKPVMPDLMIALFSHLRSTPYPHGMLTMKIIAKLGGLNRKYLKEQPIVDIDEFENTFEVNVRLQNESMPFFFSMDKFVNLSRRIFFSGSDDNSRIQSFNFLKYCFVSLLNLDGDISNYKFPESVGQLKTPKLALTISTSTNTYDPYNVEGKVEQKNKRRLSSESNIFKKLLSTILIANGDPTLKNHVSEFVDQVFRHFSLLFISQCNYPQDPLTELNLDLFLDSIVDMFSHDKSDITKEAAEATFEKFIKVFEETCEDKELMLQFLIWDKLATRLFHCCYQKEWYKKLGGCRGISCLCRNLSSAWIKKHEIDFVKALLFIIKDSQSHTPNFVIDITIDSLKRLIILSHEDEKGKLKDAKEGKEISKKLHDLLLVLVSELSSAHDAVRREVQLLLQLVSELTNQTITSLLDNFKNSLTNSIIVSRFKQLPGPLQTGFCDALRFFISLDPPLLPLSKEIIEIIHRAWLLFFRYKEESQTLVIDAEKKIQMSLKMECMKLIKQALVLPEMSSNPANHDIRDKIIETFFSSLSSCNKEIIEIAKSGLSQFVKEQKVPRELLQKSLRPVLSNLGSYTKLTIPVLQTLEHLLELCTSYFSVKLGEQLVEHLKAWTNPQKIQHLEKNDITKAAANILHLFSFLPKDSVKFLPVLVGLTLQLEKAWKSNFSEYSSPFRKPLQKYLSFYPEQTVEYFLGMKGEIFKNEDSFNLFLTVLKYDDENLIREYLVQNPDCLLFSSKLLSPSIPDEQKLGIHHKFLKIIQCLCKKGQDILLKPKNKKILNEIRQIWNDIQIYSPTVHPIPFNSPFIEVPKLILQIFIKYCLVDDKEVDILFLMLPLFKTTLFDFTFLKEFYVYDVVKFSPERKYSMIMKFLDYMKTNQTNKTEALEYCVFKPLEYEFEKNPIDNFVDKRLIEKMSELFVENPNLEESLRVEIINLVNLLVKTSHSKIDPKLREQILKFFYAHMRQEDSPSKFASFILSVNFIKAFKTPEKVILQVYLSLLKSTQSEGKEAVKKSLDILLPVLPERLPLVVDAKATTSQYPVWVKITKKMIVEEGFSLSKLIHCLQVIVRHSKIFYEYRELFIHHIVSSLSRIGLPSTPSAENKRFATDLADLIIEWEKITVEEENKNEEPMETEMVSPNSKKRKITEDGEQKKKLKKEEISKEQKLFHISNQYGEVLINFLIRAAITPLDRRSESLQIQIAHKCVKSLKIALDLWKQFELKVSIENILILEKKSQENKIALPCIGLDILTLLYDCNNETISSIVEQNLPKYSVPIINMFNIDDPMIQKSLSEFLKIAVSKPENFEQTPRFYAQLWDVLKDNFTKYDSQETSSSPHICLMMLQILKNKFPNNLAGLSVHILKILTKLVKFHIQRTHDKLKEKQAQQRSVNVQMITQISASNDLYVTSIVLLLDLLFLNSNDTNVRRQFLTTVTQMLDKSNEINPQIILTILDNIHLLVIGEEKFFKLIEKEKKFFVLKLSAFEHNIVVPIRNKYFDIILSMFTNKKLMEEDEELKENINSSFMFGLKSENSKIRSRFHDVFHQSIGASIAERLRYIFNGNNWENLSDNFWIRHALDLVLSVINFDDKIVVSDSMSKICSLTKTIDSDVNDIKMTKALSKKFESLLEEHDKNFIQKNKEITIGELILPLKLLSRESIRFSYEIWVNIFPYLWKCLESSERESIQKSLVKLLARDYHSKQYTTYPNVIQAILEGCYKSTPSIKIPPDLLKFLGKSFKVWHVVIPMLEHQYEELINDSKSTSKDIDATANILCDIYRVIGEDTMISGIIRNMEIEKNTKIILALEQKGSFKEMQEFIKPKIDQLPSTDYSSSVYSNSELMIWEDRWINSARKLQQWDELTKYAKSVETPPLMLECFWQRSDWKGMKDLFTRHISVENHTLKIYQISTALMEDRGKDSLEYLLGATQQGIQRWCALPMFLCGTHLHMLHNYQQLLELHDSTRFMQEHQRLSIQELKGFITTWRDRIPNKWDDVQFWNDILVWRHHFLLLMSKKYSQQSLDSHFEFCLNETVWNLNRLAKLSRKNSLTTASLDFLQESKKILGQIKSDTSEHFVRIYELLSTYKKENKISLALETIENDKSIQKLKTHHKLEILRIKGELLTKAGKREEAFKTFSNAVSPFTTDPRYLQSSASTNALSKCFYHWSRLLDEIITEQNFQDINLIEQTIAAVLQGCRYGSNSAKNFVSRVLWLLSYDDQNLTLLNIMKKCIVDTPYWIWIPFIPILIQMMARKDSPTYEQIGKEIIGQLGKKYPAAGYFYLRSFYFELRDEFKSQQQDDSFGSPSFQENLKEILMAPKKHSEELMAQALSLFQPMVQETESILKEFCSRLKPEPEEELGRSLESLLRLCYQYNIYTQIEIPSKIKIAIKSICTCDAFFPRDEPTGNNNKPQFLREHKDLLLKDLISNPKNLMDLINNIKKWLIKLQARVNFLPSVLPLENISRYLADFQGNEIEIPGQYENTGDKEPFVDQHDKLLYFFPQIDVVRRNKVSSRRVAVRSQHGKIFKFLLQPVSPTDLGGESRSEERMWSLLTNINQIFDKEKMSRCKSISLQLSCSIPLNHKMRLIHERSNGIPLEELHTDFCLEKKLNSDHYLIEFWKLYNTTQQTQKNLDCYKTIANEIPDDLLLNAIQNISPSWNEFYQIRRNFSNQYALTSLMSHLLFVKNRSLHKMVIGKNTGDILNFDFRSFYDSSGALSDENEKVPFRYTRNISKFISPFNEEGNFLNSFSIGTSSLINQKERLTNVLRLYMMEELCSWQNIKCGRFTIDYTSTGIDKLRNKVDSNVNSVLSKLNSLTVENEVEMPTNQNISNLIKVAKDPMNLSEMSPTWFPWY